MVKKTGYNNDLTKEEVKALEHLIKLALKSGIATEEELDRALRS